MFKIICVLVLLMLLTSCNSANDADEPAGRIIPREMIQYGRELGFVFSYYLRGERQNIQSGGIIEMITESGVRGWFDDPLLTEFIFVHDETAVEGLPDYVIAAWPNPDRIDGLVVGFNWAINRTGTNRGHGYRAYTGNDWRSVITHQGLEDYFGLTYPITQYDFVDNWQEINVLWRLFRNIEQNVILTAAVNGFVHDHIFEMYP